ncbi:MAG: FkbM family methyltransferase [Phycisphaerales bacterium]
MNPHYLALAPLRPYLWRELPAWNKLIGYLVRYEQYHGWPTKTIRGKLHGFQMQLDLNDWCQRWTYYLGRYYEAHTQQLMLRALRPGELFVDIGANIGMTALLAAHAVGPTGRVVAFEPNPDVYAILRRHVDANQLEKTIDARNCAIGDSESELTLTVAGTHTGCGTLTSVDAVPGETLRRVQVRVAVGDAQLAELPDRPMFIKIDVEGFELHVLAGLKQTLSRRKPAVLTEAVEYQLKRAGASIASLFEVMLAHGYRGYSVEELRGSHGFNSHRLRLRPVTAPDAQLSPDLLWLFPGGEHEARLKEHLDRWG